MQLGHLHRREPVRPVRRRSRAPALLIAAIASLVLVILVAPASPLEAATSSPAPTWTQYSPPTGSPIARDLTSMAYDPQLHELVLLGGYTGGSTGSGTWTWNGSEWTALTTSASPTPPRDGDAIAYDPATGLLMLLGGDSGSGCCLNDTWTFDGTTWSLADNGNADLLHGKNLPSMAYDPATRQMVLFGGVSVCCGYSGATYVWDADSSDWAAQSPQSSPSPRNAAAMAYDPASGQLLLFGGQDDAGVVGDTWDWNGTDWVQLQPADSPSARAGAVMDYDAALNEIVLFGGGNGEGQQFDDTWTWDGTNWTQQSPAASPPARSTAAGAYYPPTGQFVLFGGAYGNVVYLGDTWVFGFPAATTTASVLDDAGTAGPWSGAEATGAAATQQATLDDVSDVVPTGAVTYDFFDSSDCSGTPASSSQVTIAQDGSVPRSASSGPLPGGEHSYSATYSGDSAYASSTSPCATFIVQPVPSSTTAVVTNAASGSPWSGTEETGASASQSAALAGEVDSFIPSGTVTYQLFEGATCAGAPFFTSAVPLVAGAVPPAAASAPLRAGAYSGDAVYSGDGSYQTSTSPCAAFSVLPSASSTTVLVDSSATGKTWASTPETAGARAVGVATVLPSHDRLGRAVPASGVLTYSFYAGGSCSGRAFDSGRVSLQASGLVPRSSPTGPLAVGTYSLRAGYAGDPDYLSSVSTCQVFDVAPSSAGYRLAGGDGGVFAFAATFRGSMPGLRPRTPPIADAVSISGSAGGYVVAEANGGVFAFGTEGYRGSLEGAGIDDVVAVAVVPGAEGYWLAGADGAVYAFGGARPAGSLAGKGVDDVVGVASPDPGGYWLVGADGAVYPFGDARWFGSCTAPGSRCGRLSDIVGIAAAGSRGYWLVGRDGAVYTFGGARYAGGCTEKGSACAGTSDVVGIAAEGDGGYLLATADGAVFGFGTARFEGSCALPAFGCRDLARPIVAISAG